MSPRDAITITSPVGSLQARVLHVFKREDDLRIRNAETVTAMASSVFDRLPASRVAYVITRAGVPMFLIEMADRWFDVTAKPVEVSCFN